MRKHSVGLKVNRESDLFTTLQESRDRLGVSDSELLTEALSDPTVSAAVTSFLEGLTDPSEAQARALERQAEEAEARASEMRQRAQERRASQE